MTVNSKTNTPTSTSLQNNVRVRWNILPQTLQGPRVQARASASQTHVGFVGSQPSNLPKKFRQAVHADLCARQPNPDFSHSAPGSWQFGQDRFWGINHYVAAKVHPATIPTSECECKFSTTRQLLQRELLSPLTPFPLPSARLSLDFRCLCALDSPYCPLSRLPRCSLQDSKLPQHHPAFPAGKSC